MFHTPGDVNYLRAFKPLVSGHTIWPSAVTPQTLTEVAFSAKKRECTGVIVCNIDLLRRLLRADPDTSEHQAVKATLDDYAGSVIEHQGIEFLILNPLEHIFTTASGEHLFRRYLSKLTSPQFWFQAPKFTWELLKPSRMEAAYGELLTADFIAIDIETIKPGLQFDCIGFCGVWLEGNTVRTHSYVIAVEEYYHFVWIKKFCEELPAAKIFQNGKYDNSYLLRYGICVSNWLWDTAHLFHSWYSELPKRLDFLVSYSLRTAKFWKTEGESGDLLDRYRYNARDCWNTACSFLSIMMEAPDWALRNYQQEFPLVFPCLMAEMRGLKVDKVAFEKMKADLQKRVEEKKQKLAVMVGVPSFNSNSPKQVKQLMTALGSGDLPGTDKVSMDQFKNRHPLNELLADTIKDIRADSKVISSYLKDKIFFTDNAGVEEYPRVLYSLNPHGTDTGRLASKEHHFWCGLQIQNIKRDDDDEAGTVKDIFISDDGFYFGECDYEQAEARDTGYLSGDVNLIAAVDSPRDFHAVNASSFFGVDYDKIYSDEKKKTLDKPLRDLAKRTNHGANYNMRARMLLMTMGIKNVVRAKHLLKLPSHWTLLKVCEHLLEQFDKTYPVVRGQYQDDIKYRIATTSMLTGPTGWTRYCFGDPAKSREALNSYVAHPSQSLNAMTLNKAWWRVFVEVAIPHAADFKLSAQIHDSILFQYRVGRLDLAYKVKELMIIPVDVTDIFGITRTLVVPAALKAEATRWSELKEMA